MWPRIDRNVTRDLIDLRDRRSPTPWEVQVLGEIARRLEEGPRSGGFAAGLVLLRDAVAADACEVFAVASELQQMALVFHDGPDVEAFLEQIRFSQGEGFPGIVLVTGAAFATRSLASDDEFMRRRVTRAGYRGAACIPIRSGRGVRGCLLLGWKTPPPEWRPCVRAPMWAATLLGSVMDRAHLSESRVEVEGVPAGGA